MRRASPDIEAGTAPLLTADPDRDFEDALAAQATPKPHKSASATLASALLMSFSLPAATVALEVARVEASDKNLSGKRDELRMLRFAWPERWVLATGTVFLLLASIPNLLAPRLAGEVIDVMSSTSLSPSAARAQLWNAILKLVGVFLLGSMASFVRSWLFQTAGERIVSRLRQRVFASILIQDMIFFDQNHSGDLTNRLSSDCGVLMNALSVNLSMGLRFSAMLVGSVIMLLITSWRLTLIMLAIVPLIMVLAVIYGRKVKALAKGIQDTLALANRQAEEAFQNMRTVRATSNEEREISSYSTHVEESFRLGRIKAVADSVFGTVAVLAVSGAFVAIVYFGGSEVLSKRITVGELSTFFMYTLSVAMATGILASLYGDYAKAVGASARILAIMGREPGIPCVGGQPLENFAGEISFEHVSFTYPSRPDVRVLHDVSLTLEKGKVTALVGPSGSGKSTIMSLLLRFYEPSEGQILLDSHYDLRAVDLRAFHAHVGLVSQDPCLFSTTIRENLIYGASYPVTQAALEHAAITANCHDFIMELPEGYETQVGEKGVRLSGGQKQRITIARALVTNPRLLCLDEATSALDSESEAIVQKALDSLIAERGRTILVIAHRLSTVRNADSVLVVERGRIVEQGTHDSLCARDSVYRRLVLRQLEGAVELESGLPSAGAAMPL